MKIACLFHCVPVNRECSWNWDRKKYIYIYIFKNNSSPNYFSPNYSPKFLWIWMNYLLYELFDTSRMFPHLISLPKFILLLLCLYFRWNFIFLLIFLNLIFLTVIVGFCKFGFESCYKLLISFVNTWTGKTIAITLYENESFKML